MTTTTDPLVLEKILEDPSTGVWYTPATIDSATIAKLTEAASKPHQPYIKVVATTPNTLSATDQAKAETWFLPISGGSVTWDLNSYPEGSATVEVIADRAKWVKGPDPALAYANQVTNPTDGAEGVPWAVTPYGTILSIYRGFQDPASGKVIGVRIFDGIVMDSSYNRGSGTWTVNASDFSAMVDRVSWPYGEQLREMIDAAGGSTADAGLTDEYELTTAVKWALKEAGEFWWPNVNEQLAHGETAHFDLASSAGAGATVPADTSIGGQSAWSLIEGWCDENGYEAYMLPGSRGKITVQRPEVVSALARTTIVTGPALGTMTDFTANYTTRVNRLYYSLHGRAPGKRSNKQLRIADTDGTFLVIKTGMLVESLEATLTIRDFYRTTKSNQITQPNGKTMMTPNAQSSAGGGQWGLWIDWGDGTVQQSPSPQNPVTAGNADVYPLDVVHQYKLPGVYNVTICREKPATADKITHTITVTTTGELVFNGFWNRFGFNSATGVRRSGRVAWIGDRKISTRRATTAGTDLAADDAAIRMVNRVSGYSRSSQLSIVPLPWIVPRNTVAVDFGAGNKIKSEKHLVTSVTIPLDYSSPMTIQTVNNNIGTPSSSNDTITLGTPVVTATDVSIPVTSSRRNLIVQWKENGPRTSLTTADVTEPYTETLTHTYSNPGTYIVTVWTEDGAYDRKTVTVT